MSSNTCKPEPLKQNDNYNTPVIKAENENHMNTLVRTPLDRPIGLDLEEFLPASLIIMIILENPSLIIIFLQASLRSPNYNKNHKISDEDQLDAIAKNHESSLTVLNARARALRMVWSSFKNSDTKQAMEKLVSMNDVYVFNDIMKSLIHRQ